MTTGKTLRIVSISLAAVLLLLAVLVAAAVAAVAWVDFNRFKPQIEERVSAALGRPFGIRGNLTVDWSREPGVDGWRGWVPWPRVSAEDLTLGNPEWAGTPVMVSLKRVQLDIAPLPLLAHRVVIRGLQLTGPAADLQRQADGRANWMLTLPKSDADADGADAGPHWTVDIDRIGFDQGTVTYTDAILKADVTVQIDPLGKPVSFAEVTGMQAEPSGEQAQPAPPAATQFAQQSDDPETDRALARAEQAAPTAEYAPRDYIFGWKAAGRFRDLPFKGEGRIGGMLALKDPDQPFPVQAQVEAGRTRAEVIGTLTDPMHLGALNLRLALSGASMSDLYPLTGVTLPDTPAYSTDGRLIASLRNPAGPAFVYRNFNGKVGQSDLHGSLRFTMRKPRPKLSGQLWSNQLRMIDLGPLIGVNPRSAEAPKTGASAQPASGKVLPNAEFRTGRWRDMDADVVFYGHRILHGGRLPLSDLNTHLVMDGGKLAVDPLRFGMAGGAIAGAVQLDGAQTPMAGRLQLAARALQLKQLFPDMHSPAAQGALGQLRGNVALAGRGNSVAALLGTADGEVHALVNDGVISRSLMEIAGLNVGNYVVSKLFGDDDVKINCAATDLTMKRGVMTTRAMVFDTENSVVDVNGLANMRDETLDLTISPESKGLRIFSLRSPLYVRGTFADPQAGVQMGPLLARGAGMVALGMVLTPAAGLLALVAGPAGDDDATQPKHCANLLAEASRPARAPASAPAK